jgi:hypothetical protein
MNMYTKLMMHLQRHMYKRGRNKGDAPANKHRRSMTHFRVVKNNDGTIDDTERAAMVEQFRQRGFPGGGGMTFGGQGGGQGGQPQDAQGGNGRRGNRGNRGGNGQGDGAPQN